MACLSSLIRFENIKNRSGILLFHVSKHVSAVITAEFSDDCSSIYNWKTLDQIRCMFIRYLFYQVSCFCRGERL